MRVQILEEALEDLDQGFRFYEGQEAGLGSYFLDKLCSDIDSLRSSAAFILFRSRITVLLLSAFRLRSTTAEGGIRSRACCDGLSQGTFVDQEAVEGEQLRIRF